MHPIVTAPPAGSPMLVPGQGPPRYIGYRVHNEAGPGSVLYLPGGYSLPPRNDLRNHSPDGFQWGYGGSGPAQLALALLMHATSDRDATMNLYQHFKRVVVASIDADLWLIHRRDVRAWARSHGLPLRLAGPEGGEG